MTQDSTPVTPSMPGQAHPAGWHPDPADKHQFRYWDGARWTEHVSSNGVTGVDPPTADGGAPAAASVAPVIGPGSPVGAARPSEHGRIPLFGARGRAQELAAEVDRLRMELDRLGALSVVELEQQRVALIQERDGLLARLSELRADVVKTADEAVLQEVGIYEYRHPLSDAVAYQAELKRLRDEIKLMVRKDGGAVLAATDWTVNGSAAEGRKMVREYSKLMLRAYNAEADNLVRGLKPYKLASAIDRLTKVATTIARLGATMSIYISDPYHRLRVRELELTADYLEKAAEEKEREREEKARLREEQRAQQEMARERARLEKELQHHANALEALAAKGDEEGAARLREQLEEVERKIEDVDYRAANIRAGYVYVISNVGSFGENVIKVGMTRRLEPRDRVRELGDASVPFKFDVHALFFSDDAVGIETELHRRLADRRVNQVNLRREFFYATPAEVKAHLAELTGEMLEYTELPEALEYRQSSHAGPHGEATGAGVPQAPPSQPNLPSTTDA